MTSKLEQSITKLHDLPADQQEAVAAWLLAELAEMEDAHLTPDQQAIVDDRLSRPFDIADPKAVQTTLKRY